MAIGSWCFLALKNAKKLRYLDRQSASYSTLSLFPGMLALPAGHKKLA
jgi:hypothetical protein